MNMLMPADLYASQNLKRQFISVCLHSSHLHDKVQRKERNWKLQQLFAKLRLSQKSHDAGTGRKLERRTLLQHFDGPLRDAWQ